MTRKFNLLTLLIVFLLVACSDPCSPRKVEKVLETLDDVAQRFDQAEAIAASTPRISLSTPVTNMQEIRNEAADLELPECAERTHDALINYMDATIDLYLAFMANESDVELQGKMSSVELWLGYYHDGYLELSKIVEGE